MRIFLAGVAGLLVLVAVLLIGMRYVQMPSRSASSSVSTSTVSEETGAYKIDVAYPKFGNEKIDAQIQNIVEKAVDEFKALPPNPTPISAKSELDGEYRDAYAGPDLLGVRLDIYQFTGGAHGGTTPYGLNFHADGTPYTLDEALSLIGMSLQQVSAEAQKQLQSRFGLVQFPEGAAPKPENYSTFLIGKDTVTFIFQQYQVEAYAYGMPEIGFARVK